MQLDGVTVMAQVADGGVLTEMQLKIPAASRDDQAPSIAGPQMISPSSPENTRDVVANRIAVVGGLHEDGVNLSRLQQWVGAGDPAPSWRRQRLRDSRRIVADLSGQGQGG
jgi:hypothetical protein